MIDDIILTYRIVSSMGRTYSDVLGPRRCMKCRSPIVQMFYKRYFDMNFKWSTGKVTVMTSIIPWKSKKWDNFALDA